jgi:hypothetical protein
MTETHTVLSTMHSVRCCISLPTLSLVFVYSHIHDYHVVYIIFVLQNDARCVLQY